MTVDEQWHQYSLIYHLFAVYGKKNKYRHGNAIVSICLGLSREKMTGLEKQAVFNGIRSGVIHHYYVVSRAKKPGKVVVSNAMLLSYWGKA